ncbi:MAG: S9 family peptidase [Candidatus Aminicenantes bacterium]|nr:S9 family peptidase [Candidatus Aminicenantes bacterium]
MKAQIFLCIVALLLAAPPLFSQAHVQKVDQWLVLGPAEILADGAALPAGKSAALDYDFLEPARLRPMAGSPVQWSTRRQFYWQTGPARFSGAAGIQAVYIAIYLESWRWLQAELTLEADFPLRVYLDGTVLAQAASTGTDAGKNNYLLTMANGKHLLLLKGILPAGAGISHSLQAGLANLPAFHADPVTLSLAPDRRSGMEDVLNTVNITEVHLSPDGNLVAVALSQLPAGGTENVKWLEILETQKGNRVFTSQGFGTISHFQWLKDSRSFSFGRSNKELTDLCIFDLDRRVCRTILAGIKSFSSCWWASDNSFLVYATAVEAEKDKAFHYVKKLDDRTRFPEQRQALTLFFPESGVRQPLANSSDNFSQVRISPDGRRLLLAAYSEDVRVRPYHKYTLVLFSLTDGRREQILADPWIEDFLWSPDGKKLLLLGGPSAFAGLGSTLAAGVVPNDFDGQAYSFDLKTRKAEALSRRFAPAIGSAFWQRGGSIYFKVTDNDHARLYRCAPAEKKFKRLATGVDAVESVSYSMAKKVVYSGSGLGMPQKLFLLNLDSGNSRMLKDYNPSQFAAVRFGQTENWTFKTQEGKTLGGYICFPPAFNPSRLYPCIINYYGGTSPIGRNFGGRYPKDWYAANGYIVCVLQPSGAIGYGQEFSSIHVNDWGEITSAEIIRGVQELLRTHPYIDNRRVGAIGASYGGFMTQILASKSEMFAALVSHAGISSLSSYWGTGDWGYSYSGVASANSFPWNRKDIYVGKSPLFMAERIKNPLLLLHGEDDNNVPPGESYQMFAALKLLGKEVALVTFPGQQHFILTPAQRVRWLQTIMAWFDRWLKGQGEWWKELYPE